MATQSELIDRLFDRLAAMYGSKFVQMWDGISVDAMKRVWTDGLAGLTPLQVGDGLKKCLRRQWPPTLPEFRMLCLPDPEELFTVATTNPKSSPLAYWAAQRFGAYELRRATWASAKERWTRIVDELISDGIPEIPDLLAIENKEPEAPSRSREVKEQIDIVLSQILGKKIGTAQSLRDDQVWQTGE